jgi:hypothetical protein
MAIRPPFDGWKQKARNLMRGAGLKKTSGVTFFCYFTIPGNEALIVEGVASALKLSFELE